MTRIPDQIYGVLPRRFPDELRFSNYGLRFDGVNQWVRIPDSLSLHLTAAITAGLWLWYPSTAPTTNGLFGKMSLGGDVHSWMFYVSQISFCPSLNIYDGGINFNAGSPNALPRDRWTSMIGTYDGLNIRIYINGVQEAVTPHVGSIDLSTSYIGLCHDVWGAGAYFTCRVDEPFILPIAASAEQVRIIYRSGVARKMLDARLVLRLEENSGLVANDESGYGNNGSLLPALTPPTWMKVAKYELLAGSGA